MSRQKRKAGVALDCDVEASASSDQRTSAKTKSTYKSHLKKFVDYMSTNFPDTVAEDGSPKFPLQWESENFHSNFPRKVAVKVLWDLW
jgi:hypothetical protein